MAQIELRISSKVQKITGRREIMLRFYQGNRFDRYSPSGIFIDPEYFEYYINRSKTEAAGVKIAGNIITCTEAKAQKNGYILRKSGMIVIKQRLETPEVKYHRQQVERLDKMMKYILDRYAEEVADELSNDWLTETVERFNHPEKFRTKASNMTIYDLIELYVTRRQLVETNARVYRVLSRTIGRYEGFVRASDSNRKKYTFSIDGITREDIEDFSDYLRNEKALSEQYPKLFEKLIKDNPACDKKGKNVIQERGDNYIIKVRAHMKSIFLFALEEGLTKNRPFDGVKIGTPRNGTPYYITIAERNLIADTDLEAKWAGLSEEERELARQRLKRTSLKTVLEQRDIFVFHCFVGCRVGDLLRLTDSNVNDNVLIYTPHKTKDGEEAMQARVPLHPKAQALIEKYRGVDERGRLFPFITAQKYNDAIKIIFTLTGITRKVEIRNSKTGEIELIPINEKASSHLARRTFVGNAYFKVSDPNIIGKMSGHVEGSKAFKRYRNIEDETLKEVIDQMG